MFSVLFVCLTVVGETPPASPPRPFHEIQAEIGDLLKREVQSRDSVGRTAIVRRMCQLHGEILRDARYPTSDTLADYRVRLWSRLRRVQAEIKQQLARSSDKDHQQAAADSAALAAAEAATIAASGALSDSLALLDQSQGGPGYLLGFGGRAGPPDFGPDLVDLIEQTINPAFWDVNGGPGSIVYYAPLRCIVVRATSDMHANIGGALGGLREAGR